MLFFISAGTNLLFTKVKTTINSKHVLNFQTRKEKKVKLMFSSTLICLIFFLLIKSGNPFTQDNLCITSFVFAHKLFPHFAVLDPITLEIFTTLKMFLK